MAYSPSLGLLLRRAERNADRDAEPVHPDGCRDAWFPEAVEQDLHPAAALQRELAAWDAWDDVRRDEARGAADLREQRLAPGDDAEKLAARVPGVRERRAWRHQWELRAAPAEAALAEPEPCTQDVGRFEARSCVVPAEVEQLASWEQRAALRRKQ